MAVQHTQGELRPVVLPADEQPHANAARTAEATAERARRGRPFQKGNAASKGRVPTLALLGVPADIAAPANRSALAKADRLRRRRCSELHAAHGYVSAGVSSIVASGELALAASRVIYAKAFASSDPALFKTAAQLADSARQAELAAWELCSRESETRREAGNAADVARADHEADAALERQRERERRALEAHEEAQGAR
jgi:hypothetical protein